jgi:hypothetical protein
MENALETYINKTRDTSSVRSYLGDELLHCNFFEALGLDNVFTIIFELFSPATVDQSLTQKFFHSGRSIIIRI